MLRVRPVRQPCHPAVPMSELAAAQDQRHDAVQWTSVPFEFSHTLGGRGPKAAKADAGAPRREIGDQRFDEVAHRSLQVGLAGQRVSGHGVGAWVGRDSNTNSASPNIVGFPGSLARRPLDVGDEEVTVPVGRLCICTHRKKHKQGDRPWATFCGPGYLSLNGVVSPGSVVFGRQVGATPISSTPARDRRRAALFAS